MRAEGEGTGATTSLTCTKLSLLPAERVRTRPVPAGGRAPAGKNRVYVTVHSKPPGRAVCLLYLQELMHDKGELLLRVQTLRQVQCLISFAALSY